MEITENLTQILQAMIDVLMLLAAIIGMIYGIVNKHKLKNIEKDIKIEEGEGLTEAQQTAIEEYKLICIQENKKEK